MVIFIFVFIFFLSISLLKFIPIKLVICLEFIYIFLIFFSQRSLSMGINVFMYIIVFSAAEGVLGLTLVMDTRKIYDIKSKFYYRRF